MSDREDSAENEVHSGGDNDESPAPPPRRRPGRPSGPGKPPATRGPGRPRGSLSAKPKPAKGPVGRPRKYPDRETEQAAVIRAENGFEKSEDEIRKAWEADLVKGREILTGKTVLPDHISQFTVPVDISAMSAEAKKEWKNSNERLAFKALETQEYTAQPPTSTSTNPASPHE